MIVFGPVPSRRLGRSLGVNHLPYRVCSYSCVYCQLGRNHHMRATRSTFSSPWEALQAIQARVSALRQAGEAIDYLTFVPDGEPTLDANLGRLIDLVRPLGIPIAVITNASLIADKDVREDLMKADWVSLKVDTVREETWHRVNRPHGALRLKPILDGLLAFAAAYRGTLATETMLVAGLNDDEAALAQLAGFLAHLWPATAYLSVPTRPPAEPWVRTPGASAVVRAYEVLSAQVGRVECLLGYEGCLFAASGNAEEDLLNITAVHPMREDAVANLLARSGASWGVVEGLLAAGKLVALDYAGHRFYLRPLRGEEEAYA